MKRFLNWQLILALGFVVSHSAHAQLKPRKDINPALLYWKAFGMMPRLSEDDQKIFDYYQTAEIDDDYHQVADSFNGIFGLIHQATEMEVPVDWGYDLSEGPEMQLPEVSKAKYLSIAAALRMWSHLERRDENRAVQEILDTFVLARQVGQERILISALVEYSMEHVLINGISQNFYLFSDESLEEILNGIHNLPEFGTISRTVEGEKIGFGQWTEDRIEAIFEKAGGDASKAAEEIKGLVMYLGLGDAKKLPDLTIEEYRSIIKNVSACYDEIEYLLKLPYEDYYQQVDEFEKKVQSNENPYVRAVVEVVFPPAINSRKREFEFVLRHAFLEAAIEYRIRGNQALEENSDPYGNGPFRFERFVIDSIDRGFKLTSDYDNDALNSYIFIESSGPAINLTGPDIGTPIPGL